MKPPRIKTTVVGSYPLPDWLAAAPSEQALEDAMRTVLHIQEQAGIDLVCDGELYRFDLNHPETNGMIEYFTRPMHGIRSEIGFTEWLAYSKGAGMRFRAKPPGVVDGPVMAGTLNLSLACARAKRLANQPLKPRKTRARRRGCPRRSGEAPGRRRDPGGRSQPAGPSR
jgi:5-methyltetrahydropteroyltriglutamate--homocysteine methyltransferase